MATINNVDFRSENITISSGATTSSVLDMVGLTLQALIMPAAFTGTTLTFKGSDDNVTFYDVYDVTNTQTSMSVSAGRLYRISPGDFYGFRYIKLVSGSAEGSDRVIKALTRSAT